MSPKDAVVVVVLVVVFVAIVVTVVIVAVVVSVLAGRRSNLVSNLKNTLGITRESAADCTVARTAFLPLPPESRLKYYRCCCR